MTADGLFLPSLELSLGSSVPNVSRTQLHIIAVGFGTAALSCFGHFSKRGVSNKKKWQRKNSYANSNVNYSYLLMLMEAGAYFISGYAHMLKIRDDCCSHVLFSKALMLRCVCVGGKVQNELERNVC